MTSPATAKLATKDDALDPLPASIGELASLGDVLAQKGLSGISPDYGELFALKDRMLTLGPGMVLVFRHADLRRIGADPRVANVPPEIYVKSVFVGPAENPLRDFEREHLLRFQNNQFFTTDPLTHRLTKPIFAMPLMPKAMPPFAAIGERVLQRLIDDFAGAGQLDFVSDLALPMAMNFWGEVLAMRPDEKAAMVGIIKRMAPLFVGAARGREPIVEANDAIPDYFDMLVPIMRRAQASGDHLFLNWMSEQFNSIAVSPPGMAENVEAFMAANMIDGFHAMAAGLFNTVHHLLESPDALEAVRTNQGLVGNAVDEALRLNSPVPTILRYLIEAVDYDGLHLPAGSILLLHWNAGNKDPSVHDQAGRFVLDRAQKPLTTFGTGAQICPGRNISRTLAMVGIKALTAPGVSIESAGEVEWLGGSAVTPRPYPIRLPVKISRN